MKIAIVYHSQSGNTKRMAEIIAEGMREVAGVEAKTFSLTDIDADFMRECRCLVLGTPTYLANVCGAIKTWLDESFRKYPFAGKLAGAFATADYVHGGGDLAVQFLLNHMLVLGMLAYSGGGSAGLPVIHLGPVALKENLAGYDDTFRAYGKRMAAKTVELFG